MIPGRPYSPSGISLLIFHCSGYSSCFPTAFSDFSEMLHIRVNFPGLICLYIIGIRPFSVHVPPGPYRGAAKCALFTPRFIYARYTRGCESRQPVSYCPVLPQTAKLLPPLSALCGTHCIRFLGQFPQNCGHKGTSPI